MSEDLDNKVEGADEFVAQETGGKNNVEVSNNFEESRKAAQEILKSTFGGDFQRLIGNNQELEAFGLITAAIKKDTFAVLYNRFRSLASCKLFNEEPIFNDCPNHESNEELNGSTLAKTGGNENEILRMLKIFNAQVIGEFKASPNFAPGEAKFEEVQVFHIPAMNEDGERK